jgi:predicted metalloprotease with PDZ domain
VLTYDFDAVVRELNKVQPYDWATFLASRIRQPNQPPPLGGVDKGGYRLMWKEEPNVYDKERMKEGSNLDLTHSLGMVIDKEGKIGGIMWNGPVFKAGLVNGVKIIAVDGIAYDKERLTAAIKAKQTVKLLVQRGDRYDSVEIPYTGGMRYPHLERVGAGPTAIDRLFEARAGK